MEQARRYTQGIRDDRAASLGGEAATCLLELVDEGRELTVKAVFDAMNSKRDIADSVSPRKVGVACAKSDDIVTRSLKQRVEGGCPIIKDRIQQAMGALFGSWKGANKAPRGLANARMRDMI